MGGSNDEASLDSLKLKLDLVREARSLFGDAGAKRVWLQIGLPEAERPMSRACVTPPSNEVRRYIRERLVANMSSELPAAVVYSDYCQWCRQACIQIVTLTAFGKMLSGAGIAKRKSCGRIRRIGVAFAA
ncbi:hypothetical protein [Martelella mediterranea]|uniref:Uncharacterized protein n=1 Tax=Martelella mediterranea DSM 17316 TaxID=1122214 RepID=A0A1U9YYM2_9HYPH|nr:hypothetical protein [Martelella mediterranea]AQZ50541.1 hypothetical protein Mame_01171 [Martelella mediterranea DSM 17316]